MASGIMQESMESLPSGAGPRFRPYASHNHQVTKGRYITSNDSRGYIPVYEYPLNGQWIMMDIDDGYILWTGIWKALGNSKADIVKMLDSQPDLAPLIRRVRGGYLKIQGTWMPYEVALRLARRVAWPIRDDLVPLFGPTFPDTCLAPDQPGYGHVVDPGNARRRARRNNQLAAPSNAHHEPHANWTIVTPTSGGAPSHNSRRMSMPTSSSRQSLPKASVSAFPFTSVPSSRSTSHHYLHSHRGYESNAFLGAPPHQAAGSSSTSHSASSSPNPPKRSGFSRYAPYPSSPPTSSRRSSASNGSVALDIPSLSLHERPADVHSRHGTDTDGIVLPPIQSPLYSSASSQPSYALPPISAMEDMRGIRSQDSAAVLRRLQSDDSTSESEEDRWSSSGTRNVWGHGAFSASRDNRSRPPDETHYELTGRRGDASPRDSRSSNVREHGLRLHPQLTSCDSSSTCDPSPVSPVTPRSAEISSERGDHLGVGDKGNGFPSPQSHVYPNSQSANFGWPSSHSGGGLVPGGIRASNVPLSACRHSCEESDNEGTSHPIRPW